MAPLAGLPPNLHFCSRKEVAKKCHKGEREGGGEEEEEEEGQVSPICKGHATDKGEEERREERGRR